MKRARNIVKLVSATLLVGCSTPEIRLEKITLLSDKTLVQTVGANVLAAGYMQIEIASNEEMYSYANKRDYQPRLRIGFCDSKKWMSADPRIFLLNQTSPFRYRILADYKYDESVPHYSETLQVFDKYNLAYETRPICLRVHMGDMLPLNTRATNTLKFNLPDKVHRELVDYDQKSGMVI